MGYIKSWKQILLNPAIFCRFSERFLGLAGIYVCKTLWHGTCNISSVTKNSKQYENKHL